MIYSRDQIATHAKAAFAQHGEEAITHCPFTPGTEAHVLWVAALTRAQESDVLEGSSP